MLLDGTKLEEVKTVCVSWLPNHNHHRHRFAQSISKLITASFEAKMLSKVRVIDGASRESLPKASEPSDGADVDRTKSTLEADGMEEGEEEEAKEIDEIEEVS